MLRATPAAALTLAALSLVLVACGSGSAGQELRVFAAASLTDAFTEIGEAYEAEHTDTDVTFNFAGSPTLRAQMAQGADAHVYAAADERNMRRAVEDGLVEPEPRPFARNTLTIIVPADNPGDVGEAADLARPGIKLVLAAEEVPAGGYAREALANMAAEPAFGEDFDERVLANVVSDEPNVKAVVTKVQLGEADAAIAYATDVTPELREDIDTIPIDEAYNVAATYPAGVAAEAADREAAQAFVEFLLSEEAQTILERWGFERVR